MKALTDEITCIAQRYRVHDVYVFGSRAQEISRRVAGEQPVESRPSSDVDIAVQPAQGRYLDARDRVRLAIEFEDLFDAARVDLVVLSEARPFLAVDVVRGELLYTADPRAQAEHELYILRRAADLEPFQRERIRLILTEGAR